MRNKFMRYTALIIVLFVSSIYLNGCMMAGMGLMHGGNQSMDMGNYSEIITVIKEYNTDKYIITAEFPSMISNQANECKIKIFNKKTNSLETDAEVYLEVANDNTDGQKDHSQNNLFQKISSSTIENDYLIFNLGPAPKGKYRLSYNINKIENDIFNPPIEIQYILDNQMEMNMDHSYSGSHSIFTSPYFYVGAAAMAVMMFFVLR